MKLYIDTSNSEKITIAFNGKKTEYEARVQKSQMLLSIIERELKTQKQSLTNISEIEINLRPGSFTGLRVGTAVANSFGWALKVPINGKRQLVEPIY